MTGRRHTQGSYPYEHLGQPAPPPEAPEADLVAAWLEWERGEAADLGDDLVAGAAGDWRMAASLMVLLAEADAANPDRDRTSDGGIGDPRHQALGAASDHNPWLKAGGVGVVRARDFDVDGLDVPAAFERARALAAAGQLPQLLDGGYLIHAGRITAPDFTGWHEYTGDNPHVTHGHVSVSRDPRRFDDRRPWGIWTPPRPAARPAPAKTPPRAPAADLRGRVFDLRGEQGAQGPRVAALQRFMARVYPAYARGLAPDGEWGPRTTEVLRQFGQRCGIRTADGRNIGPQLARKLYLAGFRG